MRPFLCHLQDNLHKAFSQLYVLDTNCGNLDPIKLAYPEIVISDQPLTSHIVPAGAQDDAIGIGFTY